MGNPDKDVKTDMSNFFDDIGSVAMGIRNSSDIFHAVELFADFIEICVGRLLFLGGVETYGEGRQRILHSKFSNDINTWLQFSDAEINPFRFCASRGSWRFPDDERGAQDKIDLFESKLSAELSRNGLGRADGVSVKFGSIDFLFIVGDSLCSTDKERIENLKAVCASFLTGLSVKYAIGDLFDSSELPRPKEKKDSVITARQRQCLEWIASGKTSYEISIILGLSEHTVNNYINDACKRLGAVSRIQAVVIALQSGLIDLPVPMA